MTPPTEHPEYAGHELVRVCRDADSGLHAIIAIHDTTLGPAAGGCRLWPYASEADALTDVLRLSSAMTWKNALAGLPLGGGKSVVIWRPGLDKARVLRAFAREVEALGGRYWTAEDVGVGATDVEILAAASRYVFGRMHGGMKTGDPSPFTAGGVFEGLRACLEFLHGSDSLAGRHVAVQGVGGVGHAFCRRVHAAGGRLTIADTDAAAAERARRDFDATLVAPDAIHAVECDAFAPCALGGTLNATTIPALRARIVCGAANNQLADARAGRELAARGIVYAPDYVVNAGGMHNATGDIFGRYDLEDVRRRIAGIHDVTQRILVRARAEGRATHEVADAMAREILADARRRTPTR